MASLHASQELIDLLKVQLKDAFKFEFPIGYVWVSMNSTNPATILGYGTWTQIKDEFLYCTSSSNTTGGANSVSYTPSGSVSGSVGYHAITTSEMPSHRHTFRYNRRDQCGIGSYSHPTDTPGNQYTDDGLGWANMVNTGGNSSHNHSFSGSFSGSRATINTMPKYRTCYAWYRSA